MEQLKVELSQYGVNNPDESIEVLINAATDITNATEADFEGLKSRKWYNRLWNIISFKKEDEMILASDVASLAKLNEIVMTALTVMANENNKYYAVISESLGKIEHLDNSLQQVSATLSKIALEVRNIKYGYRRALAFSDLKPSEKDLLRNHFYQYAKQLKNLSPNDASQKLYASAVENYVPNANNGFFEGVDLLRPEAQQLLYRIDQAYYYLLTGEFDNSEYFDDFSISRKAIQQIRTQITDAIMFCGIDYFVSNLIQIETVDSIENEGIVFANRISDTEDAEFEDEVGGENDAEALDYTVANKISEERIESIVHIEQNELRSFSNKRIYLSALIACEGTLHFDNCEIVCKDGANILLEKGANIVFSNSKITDTGNQDVDGLRTAKKTFFASESPYFIRSCDFHQGGQVLVNGCTIDFPVNFIWVNGTNSVEITNSLFANINPGVIIVDAEECLFSNNSFMISKQTELSSTRSPFSDFIHIDAKTFVLKNCYFEAKDGYFAGDAEHDYSSNYLIYSTLDSPSTAVNCTFHGIPACIHGFSAVEKCLFENCRNTWEWAHGVLGGIGKITNCIFDQCRGVVFAAEDSTISDCQFVNCGSDLIISRDKAGVSIKYCKFRNISEDFVEDNMRKSAGGVIWLSRNKKSKNKRCNEITGCTFSDISSGTYIINGYGDDVPYKKTIVWVSDCVFLRCKNRTSPHELVRTEYLAKNSKVKCVCVCSGLHTNSGMDVSGEMPILEQIAPEMKTNSGEMIGFLVE